ncbi:MAG: hypothetical protein ACM4AI_19130 [Acidobacteriota bacterium]
MSAERVYRRLLVVLPSDFRDEAADELLDTFRRSHARVASRGLAARAGFWCRIVADLVVTSGAERMQQAGRDPITFSRGAGRGLLLAAIGSVIGLAAALGIMRTISGLLVGVKASDPPTFVAITVLFLAVSAIACGLPAYRASRLDPTAALRAE